METQLLTWKKELTSFKNSIWKHNYELGNIVINLERSPFSWEHTANFQVNIDVLKFQMFPSFVFKLGTFSFPPNFIILPEFQIGFPSSHSDWLKFIG